MGCRLDMVEGEKKLGSSMTAEHAPEPKGFGPVLEVLNRTDGQSSMADAGSDEAFMRLEWVAGESMELVRVLGLEREGMLR